MRQFLLAFAAIMLTGCSPRVVDVTADSYYWGKFRLEQRYRTKIHSFMTKSNDTFLAKIGSLEWETYYYIYPPSNSYHPYHDIPEAIEAYESSPQEWPEVLAALPPGTELKIVKFYMYPYNIGLSSAFAEIQSGPHKGIVASISSLSKHLNDPQESGTEPNADYLELIP